MARFAAALVCVALFAAAAAAQSEKWDQKKVTALSAELASAVSGVQNALQNSAQAQDPMLEDSVYRAGDALGLLEFEATHLNALLASGKGMKQTLPCYERLQEIHAELMPYAGQVQLTPLLSPPLSRAKDALGKLAAYYPKPS